MECEMAVFQKHTFTEEDLKKFINLWIAGNNQNLMHLRLEGFKLAPNWEHILEGIGYGVWDENLKRRPRKYK